MINGIYKYYKKDQHLFIEDCLIISDYEATGKLGTRHVLLIMLLILETSELVVTIIEWK